MGRTKLAPKPDWHSKDYFHLGMPVMKQGMTLPFTVALPDFLEHIKNDPVICITGYTLGMFFDVYEYEDYNGKLHYAYNPKRGLILKTKKAEIMEALKLRLFDVTKITVIMTNERAKEAWDLFIANTLISLRDTFVPIKSDKKSDTYYETTYQFTGINGKSYIALDTHEDTPTKLDDVKRDLDNFEVLSKIRGGLKTYKALDYANVIFHVINDAVVFKDCPNEFKDDKFKLYFGKDNNGKDIYVSQTNDFIWNTKYTKDEIAFLKYKRGKVHSNVSLWDNAIEEMNTRYISILNDELCVDLRNWFIKNQINIKYMKFNMIIINPPYDKNLHLMILEQAIQLLTEDGICINLSPIRWLQDPLAKYKKTSDYCKLEGSVAKHIKGLVVVSGGYAAEVFNAAMIMDLGIYVIDKGTYDFYKKFNRNEIVDKVVGKETGVLNDKLEYNVSDGWRVRLQELMPVPTNFKDSPTARSRKYETLHPKLSYVFYNGHTKDGKHWSAVKSVGAGGPKAYSETDNIPCSISFKSETEAVNFENSTKTTFHRYLVLKMKTDQNFPMKYVPFMGDCINPRTGLKGYKGEWTDEDFCKYFDITDSEWGEIVETMKPYL